jgi:hypothetical protein
VFLVCLFASAFEIVVGAFQIWSGIGDAEGGI